jgi:hypothetical protein
VKTIAALLFALCVMAPHAQDGAAMPASVPGVGSLYLELGVTAPRQTYRIKDKVRLEVRLRSTGNRDLYLFDDICWNPGNLLNVHVFNPVGKEVSGKSDFLRDCLPPPPPKTDDISRFRLLKPGAAYEVTEDFSIRELVPKPGDFDVLVAYHSGISAKWIREYGGEKIASLPVWTSELPTVASNRIHIVARR